MSPSLVVVGLGNPLLGDDGAGIAAARQVRAELEAGGAGVAGADFIEASAGGLRLMDLLEGYDHALILDAMVTGAPPGTVRRFGIDELIGTRNVASSHDTNLATALDLGRTLGLRLPARVTVMGIEALETDCFCEHLSPEVARALPGLVAEAVSLVRAGLEAP